MPIAEHVYLGRPDKTQVLVQDWLRAGGTLEAVKKLWDINSKRGLLHTNLVSLKYGPEAPMSNNLVRQCRGLVLDDAENWRVVARPFDKFFNHGEANAAEVDWETARVAEKLDGSLMTLYHYPNAGGEWMWTTSGTPDGSGEVHAHPNGYTYGQLARWIVQQTAMTYPNPEMWADWSFMFELTSPFNRVVVRHADSRLILLGARHRVTGEELRPHELPTKAFGWPSVQTFSLFSMPELLFTFGKMDPLQQEGYVVCDHLFNRIKVKHPGYVALHHLKGDGFTPKRVLECVRNGEMTEILVNFPEWRESFEQTKTALDRLKTDVVFDWLPLHDLPYATHEDRKAFAVEALKTHLPSCMFALKRHKTTSVQAFIREMHLDALFIQLEIRKDIYGHDAQ